MNGQMIDISPQQVVAVSQATIRFLSLETTLIPGNIKQELAVLEVFLGGLASRQLELAPVAAPAVESDLDDASKAALAAADAAAVEAEEAEAAAQLAADGEAAEAEMRKIL